MCSIHLIKRARAHRAGITWLPPVIKLKKKKKKKKKGVAFGSVAAQTAAPSRQSVNDALR